MKICFVSFAAFGGRKVNGSMTVGAQLARQLGGSVHLTFLVTWQALRDLDRLLEAHAPSVVVGLGEGMDHYVAVERFAFRSLQGNDMVGCAPPSDLLPAGPPVLESNLLWREGWSEDDLRDALAVPAPPGIVRSAWGGYYLCNALHYLLLAKYKDALNGRCGFIHLPPQEEWQKRTGRAELDYAVAFASAVDRVLYRNDWLTG